MRNSSTSTGSTPPETPDTRPSFGRRLLAFLAYGSGRSLQSSPPFQPHSAEPTWLKESRASLAMQDGTRARSEALAAAENRADTLNAAIQYALGGLSSPTEALVWLHEWNEGDEAADDELREWINGPGRELLGEAVAGRIGVPPVPPPVGRERPGPAEVRAADAIERGGYHYTPHVPDAVPFYEEAVNYSPGAFVLGGVKVGYGVTCLELGGQRAPVRISIYGETKPKPPLSDAGFCTGFNSVHGKRFCSRDPARYRRCDTCPGKPEAMFRQSPLQRSHCTHRVTRNSDDLETCNRPRNGTMRCKGCPLLQR